jgi:hypothetical protein
MEVWTAQCSCSLACLYILLISAILDGKLLNQS